MDKVSIVKCDDYEQEKVFAAVGESLRLIGFDIKSIKPGSKIMFKPNGLGAWPPEKAVTTHPAVYEAVVRIFSDAGFKLYIGESSGTIAGDSGTMSVLKAAGLADVSKKYDVRFLDFDTDKRITIEKEGNVILKKVTVSENVKKMDFIINLPKLKTHMLTGYTGAIKNFLGLIPGKSKASLHAIGQDIKDFNEILVDIYSAVTPNLTIMDGIIGMEGSGPSAGKPRQTGIIAASMNGAALDSVLVEKVGFKPGEVGTVEAARNRKLFSEVSVVGESAFFIDYKKPVMHKFSRRIKIGILYRLITPSLYADKEKCISCKACMKACPQGAITFSGKYPDFNRKKCILCYCCQEVCPQHAVCIKKPLVKLGK